VESETSRSLLLPPQSTAIFILCYHPFKLSQSVCKTACSAGTKTVYSHFKQKVNAMTAFTQTERRTEAAF